MGSFVQENKRAVVMLTVAVGAALLVFLYMLLTGGSSEPEAAPVPQATPSAAATPGAEIEQTQAEGNFEPSSGGSQINPFEPLAQPSQSADSTTDSASKADRSTSSSGSSDTNPSGTTGGSSSKGTFADPGNSGSNGKSNGKSNDKSDRGKKATPKPVAPQPVDDADAVPEGSAQVKVVSVAADSLEARVNGQKETLYLSVPDAAGVTYVSPLGSGCAWLALASKQVRVTVCEGETADL